MSAIHILGHSAWDEHWMPQKSTHLLWGLWPSMRAGWDTGRRTVQPHHLTFHHYAMDWTKMQLCLALQCPSLCAPLASLKHVCQLHLGARGTSVVYILRRCVSDEHLVCLGTYTPASGLMAKHAC